MSYRIDYGGVVSTKVRRNTDRTHIRTMTAVCMILFALVVECFWPQGQQVLQKFFLPGEPTVTEQAFSELISDLSQGIKLQEAMTAFCQQIIDHGAGEQG